MVQQHEEITYNVILEFTKTIEMFGLNTSEARLFVFMYLKKEALTLDEMGAALGKSKTSMSTSIRSLLEVNLVKRVWKKGVRKDLYEVNKPLFKIFMDSYINKWINATASQRNNLEEITKDIENNLPDEELEELLGRLRDIVEFHNKVEKAFLKMKQD